MPIVQEPMPGLRTLPASFLSTQQQLPVNNAESATSQHTACAELKLANTHNTHTNNQIPYIVEQQGMVKYTVHTGEEE